MTQSIVASTHVWLYAKTQDNHSNLSGHAWPWMSKEFLASTDVWQHAKNSGRTRVFWSNDITHEIRILTGMWFALENQ